MQQPGKTMEISFRDCWLTRAKQIFDWHLIVHELRIEIHCALRPQGPLSKDGIGTFQCLDDEVDH